MGTILPYPRFAAYDEDGLPLAGGLVYTYEPGTQTEKAAYTDRDCTVPATNPVVLGADGQAEINLLGSYKIVLKDSDDVEQWSMDNVRGMGQSSGAATSYPDSGETAHQINTGSTLAAILAAIGTTNKATVLFRHSETGEWTDYHFTASYNASAYTNVSFVFEAGARLQMDTGVTVTLDRPEQIIAGCSQQIFTWSGTGKVVFTYDGDVSPEWWGASSDGSTDSGAAINAAIVAANSAYLLDGTYIIEEPIIIYPFTKLIGMGHEKSILKLKDSTNNHVIDTESFATLTGQNKMAADDGVPHGFHLIGFSVDGNKANQTTGGIGIRIYAKRYIIADVMIYDTYLAGLYTECGWVGGQQSTPKQWDLPEALIGPISIRNCGSSSTDYGLEFKGPHDAYISEIFVNGTYDSGDGGGDNIHVDSDKSTYGGQVDFGFVHSYASEGAGFWSNVKFRAHTLIGEQNLKEGVVFAREDGVGSCVGAQVNLLYAYGNDRDSTTGAGTYYHVNNNHSSNEGITIAHLGIYNNYPYCKGGINIEGVGMQIGRAHIYGNAGEGIGVNLDASLCHISVYIDNWNAKAGVGGATNDGMGLSINPTVARTGNHVEAIIQDCEVCFDYSFTAQGNMFKITGFPAVGQTTFGGTAAPNASNNEMWDVCIRDADAVDHLSFSKGTATITNADDKFVDVTHELFATPSDGDIVVTPTEDPEYRYWVHTVGATTFRIELDTLPTNDITFAWQARI